MKIAILGADGMGCTVIGQAKQSPLVDAIVAYDIDEARVRGASKAFDIAGTTRLEEVLADPAVKLVFVTAGNHAHKELAIRAMEAGKAVLCEKPMAVTLDDARAMVEADERLGAFFQVGFELRYSKLYAKVKEWIDAGLLGRVVNTHCLYCSSVYDKGQWRNGTREGGNTFGERLSHYVDLTRWWVGEPVEEVYSACGPNVVPYTEVRDNYHTTDQTLDVIRRVDEGMPPMTPARDALATMRLCFTAEESAEKRQVVRM